MPTTRSGRQRGSPPLKRKRSMTENSEEEVMKGKGGRGGKRDVTKRQHIRKTSANKVQEETAPVPAQSRSYDVHSPCAEPSQPFTSISETQQTPPIISLCYYVLGDKGDRILPIQLPATATIFQLMEAIKVQRSRHLHKAEASDLRIFKLSTPLPIAPFRSETPLTSIADFVNPEYLESSLELSACFPNHTKAKQLDFIVVVDLQLLTISPSNSNDHLSHLPNYAAGKKCQTDDNILESWRARGHKNHLPSVAGLEAVLKTPLLEPEKIPITESMYRSLVSMLPPDECSEDDIGTLFKIGEIDHRLLLFYQAVSRSPPSNGTENSFIFFWDSNIRAPIELLIPIGQSIRNSNQHTATQRLRPDYGFLIKKVCPFRGEEKVPENPQDPKAELSDKFNWVYDPAPYMLGYYCEGTDMTLVAITAPDSQEGKPKVHDLITLNLKWRKDRIANICHLLNLSVVLPKLVELVWSGVDDYQIFTRTNSTVEITSTLIVKTYTCHNPEQKVAHLRRIYAVLVSSQLPNTDALVYTNKNVAHLSPRGRAGQPLVEKELRECVICILELLKVAHQVPIYHRDIRWDNVIRKIEDHSKWFLIHWEDAALPPTNAEPTFQRSTHSPAVFQDGHGAEVDIWGVGYLIKTSTAEHVSPEMRALGERICNESHILSAAEVLTLVNFQSGSA